jgi:hypothetical protein
MTSADISPPGGGGGIFQYIGPCLLILTVTSLFKHYFQSFRRMKMGQKWSCPEWVWSSLSMVLRPATLITLHILCTQEGLYNHTLVMSSHPQLCVCLCLCLSNYQPTFCSTIHVFTYNFSMFLPIYLLVFSVPKCLYVNVSFVQAVHLSTCPQFRLSICPLALSSSCPSIHLPSVPAVHLSTSP